MKKWLFILLSIGLILSCTDEVNLSENQEEDLTNTTGYLEVYLRNPVATRSTWSYEDYFPNSDIFSEDSKEERLLHNLSIAYFDNDFLLEHFATTIDLSDMYPYSSDIYAGYTAESKKEYSAFTLGMAGLPLTTGAHYFYILCNLPQEYLSWLSDKCRSNINNLTKDEFEKFVLDYPVEGVTNVPYDTLGISKETGKPYRFRRCLMTNITSPAPHYMADKSLIVGSGSYPAVNGISMDIGKSFAKISLAYVPGQTKGTLEQVQYRIANDPKRMYMLPNIFNAQVHTPHYNAHPDDYASFDDYFREHFNSFSAVLKNNEEVSDDADEANDFRWRAASTPENTTSAYCMENGNQTPLQGNSTMILVKATYVPEEWLNPDGTPGNKSNDNTFWRVKNSAGEYLPGYYNSKPVIRSTQTAVKYQNGITYYPIWLQTDGKYMVARNHYYKIAITEVINAGEPDLESVFTPETPLESSSTQIRSVASGDNISGASNGIRWEQNN